MVGAGTAHISEHAFGNALDIAAFTLADGRTITVQDGWHGSPEEQGFLHDVQLYACETFTTVLAPGYNAAHYNHIHVDLMRRASGRRPVPAERDSGRSGRGARARAIRATARRRPIPVRSPQKTPRSATLIAGADGEFDDDAADAPASPRRSKVEESGGLLDFGTGACSASRA